MKEEENSYFQLDYKLNLLNSCPIHNCILLTNCPSCKTDFKPHKQKYDQHLYYCYNCNADIRNVDVIRIIYQKPFQRADIQIRMVLEIGTCTLMNKMNIDPSDFFDIIYQLISFLIKAYDIKDPLFSNMIEINYELLEKDWRELKTKLRFFQNPTITFLLIEATFTLLNNEKELSRYIHAKQSIYNRTLSNAVRCSPFLKRFLKTRKMTSPSKEEIIKIIEKLKSAGKPINNRTIAKEGEFDYYSFNYSKNKHLRKLIEEVNEEQKIKIEKELIEIIYELKKEQQIVSMSKVSKKMGIKPSIIFYSPNLRRHFLTGKLMNPTYIPRINQAIKNLKLQKKRLTITEVAKEADFNKGIIYRHQILREIVEEAIRSSKHPKYEKIKGVIDSLEKENVILTRDLIAEKAGISVSILYDHPELQKLLENVLNNLENHKKRLTQACSLLEKKKMNISIKSILKEARMDDSTLRRNSELVDFTKKLIFESKKRRILKAFDTLKQRGEEISHKTLLKESDLAKAWKKKYQLKKYLSNNKDLNDFISTFLSIE